MSRPPTRSTDDILKLFDSQPQADPFSSLGSLPQPAAYAAQQQMHQHHQQQQPPVGVSPAVVPATQQQQQQQQQQPLDLSYLMPSGF
jgi:hypothetical protein